MQIWAPSYAEHGQKVMPYTAMPAAQNHRRGCASSVPTALSYDNTILADSPVHYYPLNDTSGHVVDVVAGLNSTAESAVNYLQTAIFDDAKKSMSCTAGANKGLVIGGGNYFTTPSFSIEFQFIMPTLTGANIFTSNGYSGQNWIRTQISSTPFRLQIASQNDTPGSLISTLVLSNAIPYHAVFTYDSSSTLLTIYVNAVSVGTSTQTISHIPTGTKCALFCQTNVSSGMFTGFAGSIAKVAFYSYALTSAQVSTHYAARFNH